MVRCTDGRNVVVWLCFCGFQFGGGDRGGAVVVMGVDVGFGFG